MRSPTASTFLTTRPQAKGGRGERYASTIVNAHHVSQARMLSPCARLVRIISPTLLPRRYARRPRCTLRSHDRQRASRKPSVHAVAFCSPCAHHFPHCTAQARRAAAAAYATLARLPLKIFKTRPRAKGGRGVNAHHVLCSPFAHHSPHHTSQAAAYATFVRWSTHIT
jgi:hypothetical protein